jgi:hypothetical protein
LLGEGIVDADDKRIAQGYFPNGRRARRSSIDDQCFIDRAETLHMLGRRIGKLEEKGPTI